MVGDLVRYFEIYSSLLEENKELKRDLQNMTGWKEKALQLEQKNAQLRALNNVKLSEDLIWVTGEMMADSGRPFYQPGIENIGLENIGITVENDKIIVDEFYKTNVEGFYAIGDVVSGPALAHVASAEGITCVENIKGLNTSKIDYNNIPGCTYCKPEIASVGFTEKQAIDNGYEIKVGKFPFSASGKAQSSGAPEGFVKVIFDAKYGEWLGCHMIGSNVTEMISEAVVGRKFCLLYTSPSPRDLSTSRMPSSA